MENYPVRHRLEPEVIEPEIVGFEPKPSLWRRLAARAVLSLALIAIGLAICLIGGLLTISIIGAAVGIPLIIFGAAVVLLAVYLLFGGGKIKIIDLRRFY